MPNEPIYQTPEWRQVRRLALRRDHHRCVVCHCSIAGKGQARVDHIVPIKRGGSAFDLANLRSLCVLHDNQAHREKAAGGSGPRHERFTLPGYDADGIPLDPAHHWR